MEFKMSLVLHTTQCGFSLAYYEKAILSNMKEITLENPLAFLKTISLIEI